MDKNKTTWNHNKNHSDNSSNSENEGQERNQLSRPEQSTPNGSLKPTETNHLPLVTSSDSTEKPTEIKHQQALSLEHLQISYREIKTNMKIRYKVSKNDPWGKAQTTNRAGEAPDKNYSWWNITNQNGSKQAIDLNAINCWEISDSKQQLWISRQESRNHRWEYGTIKWWKNHWWNFYRTVTRRNQGKTDRTRAVKI